ncbi:MAG TPA: aldose epimerase family protein [Pseudomonadales bacterium]|nr:aldose epimerase family protein [Pseudomonadales bacterium]
MIARKIFGSLPDGREIEEFHFQNSDGLSAKVITYGGIITQLCVPEKHGKLADVVLGFDNLAQYLAGHPYFGCITGRVAGRLTRGTFSLDGKRYTLAINDPPNHLHGGNVGFDKRVWKPEVTGHGAEAKLSLSYISPDGEEGYPGNVKVHVTYSLTDKNEFVVGYEASTDQATPLNLTSHSYFNLAGEGNGSVEDHELQIFAKEYAPADETMTHLDLRKAVAGAGNDFSKPQRMSDAIPKLWKRHGDNYFVRGDDGLKPVASLIEPKSGRKMEIFSTAPCVQFYTGVSLDGTLRGKSGRPYARHGGLCLECQGYPNGVNAPALGDIVLRPGQTYRQTTVHKFSVA